MLKDLVLETYTVKYRNGEFQVCGVSVDDIARLLVAGERNQLESAFEEMQRLYELSQSGNREALDAGLSNLVMRLPQLAAKLIAIAAGEPDQVATVGRLPLPVQLEAIIAVGRLTFDSEDSVRNFIDGLTMLANQTRRTLTRANGQMKAGFHAGTQG